MIDSRVQAVGTFSRRDLLKHGGTATALIAAQALAPALFSGCSRPLGGISFGRAAAEPVKVGILHSETGTMSISESSLRDVELMAIDEINAQGGVLGRTIEAIVEDGRSRARDVFPRKARKLLMEDHVVAVFGCW